MQFLVIGYDGKDEKAMDRRSAARQAHIDLGDELVASGNIWYGAVLLDNDEKMNGTMLMMDFKNHKELDEWLERESYVAGRVWEKIEIYKCKTRDPWQFNRSKEWFEKRSESDSQRKIRP